MGMRHPEEILHDPVQPLDLVQDEAALSRSASGRPFDRYCTPVEMPVRGS